MPRKRSAQRPRRRFEIFFVAPAGRFALRRRYFPSAGAARRVWVEGRARTAPTEATGRRDQKWPNEPNARRT
jgi:hypothetical protein